VLRVAEIVANLSTDVIALHEITPEQAQQIVPLVAAEYSYQILNPSETGEGLILLSRYPIENYEFYQPLPGSHSNVRAVITVSGVPVTVYAVHLQRPRLVTFPFSYDVSDHDAEVADLRDRLRAETGPVLVLCDCNMSDQSDAYQTLDRLLDDAFREAGQGLGFTFRFRRFLPFMARIDYVWYSDDFVALEAYPWNDSGSSDHRPVVATLSLKVERFQDK
jgi:vancomycin resistance protein VanJ